MYIGDVDKKVIEDAVTAKVEDFSKSQSPGRFLYHYTNSSGLYGITNSNQIFASNISYLNDAHEYKYSIRVLIDTFWMYAKSQIKSEFDDEFIQYCITRLGQMSRNPGFQCFFVACFSVSKNDLAQWRAYGRSEGGIAIGLDATELIKTATDNNALLVPVLYDRSEQEEALKELIEDVLAVYNNLAKENISVREGIQRELFEFLMSVFGKIFCIMKNESFGIEKEWRIIKRESQSNIKFMPAKQFLKPYIPIVFHRIPIRELWAGPGRLSQLCLESARAMLENEGYDRVDYKLSNISYRVVE